MAELTEHDVDTRRLKSCVDRWSEAASGEYNPACCRFPKSCSPHGYIEAVRAGNLTESDLESAKVEVKETSPVMGDRRTRVTYVREYYNGTDWVPVPDYIEEKSNG